MKRALSRISLLLVVFSTANLIPCQAQKARGPEQSPAGQSAPPTNLISNDDKEKVLLTFPGGTRGGNPSARLIFDTNGNLYGTTSAGGGFSTSCPNGWCGTAFELTPTSKGTWKETVLYDFKLGKGSAVPDGGLVFDSAGNLYGTTYYGGRGNCIDRCGVVFELTRTSDGTWKETVVYAFSGGTDGGIPLGGVIFDKEGNLYGAAGLGGSGGRGVVFELTPTSGGKWKEKVLYAFTGGRDGSQPSGGLIFDAAGNLYGAASDGGSGNCAGGCGVVFELVPRSHGKWQEKVLHGFTGIRDGGYPNGDLIFDSVGNVYGTTNLGGSRRDCQGFGCGVVFKLAPTSNEGWKETVLHTFTGSGDGAGPASLTFDAAGNLYGTAYDGGITKCSFGCGVAFKLTPTSNGEWNEIVLHSFTGGNDGGNPGSGLIFDSKGNLYGSTVSGGADSWGVIFELTP